MAWNDAVKTLTQARVFNPVTEALWDGYRKATEHLEGLTDAELWQAEEWVAAIGQTNCGWLEYRLQEDLAHHIRWIQRRREANGTKRSSN